MNEKEYLLSQISQLPIIEDLSKICTKICSVTDPSGATEILNRAFEKTSTEEDKILLNAIGVSILLWIRQHFGIVYPENNKSDHMN